MVVESDGLLDESCLGVVFLLQEVVCVWFDQLCMDDLVDLIFLVNNIKVVVNLFIMLYFFIV